MSLAGLPLFDWRPPLIIVKSAVPSPLYTINRDNKFDIQLNVAQLREHKLGRLVMGGKIELKSNTYQWRRTGNIPFEYAQHGRPSGLAVCEADVFVQELNDDEGKILVDLMFPLERAKELARWSARRGGIRHGCGDSGAVDLVAVSLHDFVDWLLKGGGDGSRGVSAGNVEREGPAGLG